LYVAALNDLGEAKELIIVKDKEHTNLQEKYDVVCNSYDKVSNALTECGRNLKVKTDGLTKLGINFKAANDSLANELQIANTQLKELNSSIVFNFVNVYINYVNPNGGYNVPYNFIFFYKDAYFMIAKKYNSPLIIYRGVTKESMEATNYNLMIKKESRGRIRLLFTEDRQVTNDFIRDLFFTAIKAVEAYNN
jgi:hypothetical protein